MTKPDFLRASAWRQPVGPVIGVLVLFILAGSVAYRGFNSVWPFETYPTTLHACGRDWAPAETESRAQITKEGHHLARHGDVQGWLNHAQVWTDTAGSLPGGCGGGMWVRGDSNTFKAYDLQGGP